MKNLLLVGFGGMIGSVLRYLTLITFRNTAFPYGTLLVNIVGSFAIGVVIGLSLKQSVSSDMRLFIATGVCGGFTTFSAFSAECLQLLNNHKYGIAFLYIAASIVLGLAAAFAGWVLTK